MVSRLRGNDSSGVGWQFRKLTDLCGCVFRKRATSNKILIFTALSIAWIILFPPSSFGGTNRCNSLDYDAEHV